MAGKKKAGTGAVKQPDPPHASAFFNQPQAAAAAKRRTGRGKQSEATGPAEGPAAAVALAAAAAATAPREQPSDEPSGEPSGDGFDQNDYGAYAALLGQPSKQPKRQRAEDPGSDSSDSDSSCSGSDSSDSDSPPSKQKGPVSPRTAVRSARQHAKRVRNKLQGDNKGKPVLLRTEALMRFSKPIRGLARAAKRGDLASCRKATQQVAQLFEAQAKDLLIAAEFGWDAVGALDDSSGPFSTKELKRIRQRIAIAKAARQASEGKGGAHRPAGPTRTAAPPPPQQRYPGFRPNATFPDYRPPRSS